MSILSSIDQMRQRACAFGPGPQGVAVAIQPGTGRTIPTGAAVDQGTLWMTVTCATSDVFAPRVDLKTIPR